METLNPAPTPADLVGSYRSFGEFGPVYQITSRVNGQKVHVVVVETGEELDYPIDQALQDPAAQ
ncbi:DUF5397 family protein [Prosthecobacter sp.]|uniref:DUF5397 family protein n=1 Tax=Prosthecobacter sp. TaxID=1965333 RepID=UPI003784B23A